MFAICGRNIVSFWGQNVVLSLYTNTHMHAQGRYKDYNVRSRKRWFSTHLIRLICSSLTFACGLSSGEQIWQLPFDVTSQLLSSFSAPSMAIFIRMCVELVTWITVNLRLQFFLEVKAIVLRMPKEVHLKVYTMYKFAFAVSCTLFNMLIRFLCAVVCFENVLARSLKSSFRTKMSWLVTHYMFRSCIPLPLPIPILHNSLSQNRSNPTHCVHVYTQKLHYQGWIWLSNSYIDFQLIVKFLYLWLA